MTESDLHSINLHTVHSIRLRVIMIEIEQDILNQLANRRRVEEAIGDNPVGPAQAARWQAASALDELFWTHLETALLNGSTDVKQPLQFSFEQACLINFGITFDLIEADLLNRRRDQDKSAAPQLSPREQQHYILRCRGFLEMSYSEQFTSSGVYNFEPWLQEMYRDSLDLDYLAQLREQKNQLEEDIRATPKRLVNLGIPDSLVTEIIHAFRRFQRVQGTSQAREKGKSDILHARDFASVQHEMNTLTERASAYAAEPVPGDTAPSLQSVLETWKQSSFELMDINRQFKRINDLSVEHRTQDLREMIEAIRGTLTRSAEDIRHPPCSILDSQQAASVCPLQVIESEFKALLMHDIIGGQDLASERVETRKFGPLCAVIVPGVGRARYSTELRDVQTRRLQKKRSSDHDRREYDLDRRTNYPLNYLIIPNTTPPENALEQIADAFLEYKSIACTNAFNNFISEIRVKFSAIHSKHEIDETESNPYRRQVARYMAGFVRWATYGRVADLPQMQEFIDWARQRIPKRDLLVLPRYRCSMEDFADATPQRRETIYRRHMRDRYRIDRELLSLALLRDDLKGAMTAARFLPTGTRDNRYFRQAVEAARGSGVGNQEKALAEFRRFMLSDLVLKHTYLATESRFVTEIDMLRTHAENKLGKQISHEDAAGAVARRMQERLGEQRRQVNRRIDRNLVGLLFSVEGNYTAAIEELEAYLQQMENQREARARHPQTFDGSHLTETLGNREQPRPDGRNDKQATTFEDDFVYYNLGTLALRAGDKKKANDWFSRFCLWAAQANWYLFGQFARVKNEEIARELESDSSA